MGGRRSDEDFRREIDAHLAIETDRLVADGLSPDAAREAAVRRFGNLTATRERFYESQRVLWLDHLRHDLRYAIRGLVQTPAFTVVAVLSLALGIAATTAVAAGINAVFFHTPPVQEPASLRTLSWTSPQRAFTGALFRGPTWDARRIYSFPERICREMADRIISVADVACWRDATEALTESGLMRVHAVSGSFFRTLGVAASAGRTLDADDDRPGAPLVAMARRAELLGKTVRLHHHDFTVVGVLREGFSGLQPLEPADLVVAFAADHLFPTFQRNTWAESRIVVRLQPGVAAETARAESELFVQQMIRADPPQDAYQPPRLHFDDLSAAYGGLQQNVERPLGLLAATVALLLIITCANVGGLLFARGRARHRELATRLALGGSRRRVVQQLLTESFVLGAAGAVVGVALAVAVSPRLPRLLSELGQTPALALSLQPDVTVLIFAVGVSMLCGGLFGLLPAIGVTRVDPVQALKQASGVAAPVRLRSGKLALVVQLALSMVVMVGAGLLLRTVINLRAVPLGYEPEGLLFVETTNPAGRPRAFVDDTLAAIQALPGVTSAAVSQWPIFNNAVPRVAICVPGDGTAMHQLDYSFVFPGFFGTWGVRFLAGRDFDRGTDPGVIVNETFVRQFLRGQDPLTAAVSFGRSGCPGPSQMPIVGVVADHIDRQRVEVIPAVYGRYPRGGALYVTTYAVRTNGDERALIPAFRRAIADRGLATNRDVRRAVEYRDSVMRQERMLTMLFALFAVAALSISCLGVYGLLAYVVTWRHSEIGLRMAVGARHIDVAWMIVGESLRPVVAGIGLGLIVAMAAVRSVDALLFGVPGHDPVTLLLAALVALGAAGAAAWLPARRASRVDPAIALRCE